MPLATAPRCPTCGHKEDVRKIFYGMPASEPDPDKYAIGGCCISADGSDPLWICLACDVSFGRKSNSLNA